jgi:hypothetical protein
MHLAEIVAGEGAADDERALKALGVYGQPEDVAALVAHLAGGAGRERHRRGAGHRRRGRRMTLWPRILAAGIEAPHQEDFA